MIISRTPFRMSFLGGGTDLPAFYTEEEGMVLSTTIDKYMYLVVKERFEPNYRISYSKTEIVDSIDQIQHQIVRAVLQRFAPNKKGLEIVSMSDIPAGTGLGSSSAFTVGLIHALQEFLGEKQTAAMLAEGASQIELEDLGEPIGKQDQYASAFGGLQAIYFKPDGRVVTEPVSCAKQIRNDLERSIVLFYTGMQRSASAIFKEYRQNAKAKRETLKGMKTLALELKTILESGGSLKEFGRVLDEGWKLKRTMASGISGDAIDEWYSKGLAAGAWGGKVLGAGGGGFLMFLCSPECQPQLKTALSHLRHIPVSFENGGSQILFVDPGH